MKRRLVAAGSFVAPPRTAMYLWLTVPAGLSSATFGREVLEQEKVVVMPGSAVGPGGEGYVRVAFTVDPDRLRDAARRRGRVLTRLGATGARA